MRNRHQRRLPVARYSVVDPLEPRCLLSGNTLSVEEVASLMRQQEITGATIITHGYQLTEDGDALMSLATAVRTRADAVNGNENAWLLDYDVRGSLDPAGVFDVAQSQLPLQIGGRGEVVLLFDWARASNEASSGWGEAAGDALFSLIVQLGLANPNQPHLPSIPLHFIGHSFGTAVTSEAVERLGTFGCKVGQVTYLDPHEFNQSNLPIDGAQRLFELGQPDGYGAVSWENVSFVDVYYQTRGGNYQNPVVPGFFNPFPVPNGRPVPGSYNRILQDNSELPLLSGYPVAYHGGDHSWVWNGFYLATVQGFWPSDLPQPEDLISVDLSSTGFALTRLARLQSGGSQSVIDPTFLFHSGGQDHKYSVTPLTSLGQPVSTEDGNTKKWTPTWNEFSITNGDFSHGNFSGWTDHEGGHFASFVIEGAAQIGFDGASADAFLTHNRIFVSPLAKGVEFLLRVTNPSNDDVLRVSLAGEVIGEVRLNTIMDRTGVLIIPDFLKGKVGTIDFRVSSNIGVIDSTAYIDDVRFVSELPEVVPIAGGPYEVAEGGSVLLNGSASVTGRFTDDTVEYWWDLDGDGVFGETTEFATRGYERGKTPRLFALSGDDGTEAEGNGTFFVSLQVVAEGLIGTPVTASVRVVNTPPVITITGPSQVSVNQSVTFSASAYDPSIPDQLALRSSEWQWVARGRTVSFQGTGSSFSFTPEVREQFDVSVTVLDKDGGVTTATRVINLEVANALSGLLDVRIDSSIVYVNEVDLYAVSGQAGRTITVSAFLGNTDPNFSLGQNVLAGGAQIRLISPHGVVLATLPLETTPSHRTGTFQQFQQYDVYARLDEFVLPENGTYFVEVGHAGQGNGRYWLGISNPLASFAPLSKTESTQTAFGVRGDVQEWEFPATAGQAVGWTYQGRAIQDWRIVDINNSTVATGPGGSLTTIAFTPTQTATYRLILIDNKTSVPSPASEVGPLPYTLSPADVTAPSSRIEPLVGSASGLTFEVVATAADNVGTNLAPPSGVEWIDFYVAVDRGDFLLWTTVSASTPSAVFTGQSNHIYWFYSVARDRMGNTELKSAVQEAFTSVGDFDSPETDVVRASAAETGLFTVDIRGADSGGSGLKTIEAYVQVDGAPAKLIAAIPAGIADNGVHRATVQFQGIVEGLPHSYRFFTVGVDTKGNREAEPTGDGDVLISATFMPARLEPTAIDVQRGATQRSFVRYVDMLFNDDDQQSLLDLVNGGRIRLERFAFNTTLPTPGTGTPITLNRSAFTLFQNRVQIDFGEQGIGGNRNTNAGDGFYQLIMDLDGNGTYSDSRWGFHRMFGDANGDGAANSADVARTRSFFGQSGSNLDGDLNGDRFVNSLDILYASRESVLGKKLNSSLFDYLND